MEPSSISDTPAVASPSAKTSDNEAASSTITSGATYDSDHQLLLDSVSHSNEILVTTVVNQAGSNKTTHPNVQNTLSCDVTFMIFQYSNLAAATCFGLTCRTYYTHLKTFHPEPIRILLMRTPSYYRKCHGCIDGKSDNLFVTLRCLIGQWIGNNYRVSVGIQTLGQIPEQDGVWYEY